MTHCNLPDAVDRAADEHDLEVKDFQPAWYISTCQGLWLDPQRMATTTQRMITSMVKLPAY